jgi:hypothetical protein
MYYSIKSNPEEYTASDEKSTIIKTIKKKEIVCNLYARKVNEKLIAYTIEIVDNTHTERIEYIRFVNEKM